MVQWMKRLSRDSKSISELQRVHIPRKWITIQGWQTLTLKAEWKTVWFAKRTHQASLKSLCTHMTYQKAPWIKLGIDLFEHKDHYILIVDYFNKFPIIHKLTLSTGTVISELKGIFSENGICEVIISDRGPQFRSEFKDFEQEWGFQHIESSPYHHQSNGEAERFVRTVKDSHMEAYQSDQDPDMALLCYRLTPISSKLPLPAELTNSRRYRTLLPTWTILKSREGEREELLNLKQRLEQYYNKTAGIKK